MKAKLILIVAILLAVAIGLKSGSQGASGEALTFLNSFQRAGVVNKGDTVSFEDSAFGIFAAFTANEFGYFSRRMGFDNDAYWTWAENHMRTLGAHWTRSNLQFVWDLVEPEIGAGYNWDNQMLTDPIAKRIYREGNAIHWLAVFHEGGGPVTPPMPARRAQHPPLRNPLDDPDRYRAFVRASVERYDGDGINDAAPGVHIKYWQAGNEILFWTASGRTAQDYVRYFRLIREAAREADPTAKFVLIAPTQAFTVDPFLAEVIDALATAREFDALDIHHWGHAGNWKMTAVPLYRRLLDSRGLTAVQIWSCEHGTWNGAPSAPPPQSEQDQARSLVRRFVYNLNHGLDKLFWNNLMEWRDFSGDPASIFNSMGLMTDGQGPGEDPARFHTERVAYWAYKMLASKIDARSRLPSARCPSHARRTNLRLRLPAQRQRQAVLYSLGGAVRRRRRSFLHRHCALRLGYEPHPRPI